MSKKPDNIEERLIPYIEGVLNPREQREVAEAIQADPVLARTVAELKEVIGDLRRGFASGLVPPQETLTPQEVVELAAHDGSLETMPGSSELKARLFSSDQALEEYRMLLSLSREMSEASWDGEIVPPMPASLLSEFKALERSDDHKVLEFAPKRVTASLWRRASSFLDRIDPKPLMATAAAFALISFGVHFYSQPVSSTNEAAEPMVGYGVTEDAEAPTGKSLADEGASGKVASASEEPSGVAVFTSGDKELLDEQAQKLLANKVRYTVTEDRILVSEKNLAEARSVLWGDDGSAVAVAESSEEDQLRPRPEPKFSSPPSRMAPRKDSEEGFEPQPPPLVEREVAASEPPPPLRRYDLRGQAAAKSTVPPTASAHLDSSVEIEGYSPGAKNHGSKERSALKKVEADTDGSSTRSAPEAEISAYRPGSPRPGAALKSKPLSPEERREKLRRLALGEEEEPTEAGGGSPSASADKSVRVEMSRARTAPPPASVVTTAPVPNVVSSDLDLSGVGISREGIKQDGGAVAVQAPAAPSVERGDVDVVDRVEASPVPIVAEAEHPSAGLSRSNSVKGSRVESEGESYSATSADMRLVSIREAQPAVARKFNVVLSVESRGGKLNVYVRPRGELNKSELDKLRSAIRADLGLAAQDSIIFR